MRTFAFILVVMMAAGTALGCPFCRDATASAGSGGATPVFNHSIYFMLGGLFTAGSMVVGALSTAFWRRG
ncbi:MAG TPA: hypothetical protein VMD30_12380 [Tepidisphaeraceae bacterium]|nr:hypothetical protein [Tepidisphaeraceae bacterium]